MWGDGRRKDKGRVRMVMVEDTSAAVNNGRGGRESGGGCYRDEG